ncbi:MAG TPA: hypothetical protein VGB63_17310 [Pedobacter sp.]|jgi:hypothetical protein
MKKSSLILCLLFSVSFSFAQQSAISKTDSLQKATENTRARNIYVELAGPGLIYSANFDSRFGKTRNGLGGRIGAGYLKDDSEKIFTLPVGLNYLLGNGKHFFELGVGATYVAYDFTIPNSTYYDPYSGTTTVQVNDNDVDFHGIKDNGALGTMTFGYRLQPLTSGFSVRGQFNTLFGYGNFAPYGGLSLGYTF